MTSPKRLNCGRLGEVPPERQLADIVDAAVELEGGLEVAVDVVERLSLAIAQELYAASAIGEARLDRLLKDLFRIETLLENDGQRYFADGTHGMVRPQLDEPSSTPALIACIPAIVVANVPQRPDAFTPKG